MWHGKSVENPWKHRGKEMQNTYAKHHILLSKIFILGYFRIFSDILRYSRKPHQQVLEFSFLDILGYSRHCAWSPHPPRHRQGKDVIDRGVKIAKMWH